MNNSILDRWAACSPRERRMLALMAAAIVAFLYWFAAARPLQDWSGEARARHAAAVAEEAAIGPYLMALQSLPAQVERAAPTATALANSARAIGLDVIGAESVDGEVEIRLAPSPPDLLFAWLEQQRVAGNGPQEVQLDAGSSGVSATLRF